MESVSKYYTVYRIINSKNNKSYIGRTTNFESRKKSHLNMLRKGNHHSFLLQDDWNLYKEKSFSFEIIESELTNEQSILVEEKLINTDYENNYNISKFSFGGDNISYHPKNIEIIDKISKTIQDIYDNMSDEDKKIKHGLPKERNGMYGRKHSPESRLKISKALEGKRTGRDSHFWGKKLSKERKIQLSEQAKLRIGEKNPFFGKHHSDQAKNKISNATKKRMAESPPSNARKVVIDGVEFESGAAAARELGVSNATIIHRIKSKNKKYNNYFYSDEISKET